MFTVAIYYSHRKCTISAVSVIGESSQFSIHQNPSSRFTAVDLAHALFTLVQECFRRAIHTKLKGGDAKSSGTRMILELVARAPLVHVRFLVVLSSFFLFCFLDFQVCRVGSPVSMRISESSVRVVIPVGKGMGSSGERCSVTHLPEAPLVPRDADSERTIRASASAMRANMRCLLILCPWLFIFWLGRYCLGGSFICTQTMPVIFVFFGS